MVIRVLAGAVYAVLGLMQPEPGTPRATAPETAPLAGPSVPDAPRRSLIQRDFDGTLRRLEIPPEEAALELLALTPQEREETNRIIAERVAAIDAVIGDNLPLLLELKTAKEAGNAREIERLTRELLGQLRPLRAKGRLVDQLAGAMDPQHGAELRRLTSEYLDILFREAVAQAEQVADRNAILRRELVATVGLELKRAYESRIAGQAEELEALCGRLGLDAEQEGKVRARALEFAQRTLGKPTEADRRELFRDLNKILTADQRSVLLREIYRPSAERTSTPSK